MSSRGSTTLYVSGFGQGTRARDLAYEFERYGRLVRCDIPAPRTASSRLFAFVEYESRRDADDAYHEMHNKRIGRDDLLKIEWARTPPSASWRFDAGAGRDRPRRSSPRRRSRSPPRGSGRDYSPRRDDRGGRERDHERRDGGRERERERSRSPVKDDGLRDRDMTDVRERRSEEGDEGRGADGEEDAHVKASPRPAEDELDTAE